MLHTKNSIVASVGSHEYCHCTDNLIGTKAAIVLHNTVNGQRILHVSRKFYHTVGSVASPNASNAAFLWCRIYRVYDFRVGNNVLVTSQLVFTSRELVKKKAAPVGEWLATFTLFPLSPVQKKAIMELENC